jgi:hypothetical protein
MLALIALLGALLGVVPSTAAVAAVRPAADPAPGSAVLSAPGSVVLAIPGSGLLPAPGSGLLPAPGVGAGQSVRTVPGAAEGHSGEDSSPAPVGPPGWLAAASHGSAPSVPQVADLPRVPPAVAPPAGAGPPPAEPTRTADRPTVPGAARAPPSVA